jgi:insecticidal toxin complex protein TccC
MPDFVLYRADGRSLATMQSDFSDGFKAWCPLDTTKARKFMSLFCGSSDTSGLPAHLDRQFRGKTNSLGDLSAYIKWTKNKSETVWTSCAINDKCGGQISDGDTIFKITITLNEYLVTGSRLSAGQRTGRLKPSLLLDGTSIANSTIIAINHGPLDDAEISFITTVPLDYVTTA